MKGKILLYILFFLLSLTISFSIYAKYMFYSEGTVNLRGKLGNFDYIRKQLSQEDKKAQFSFAIVGDTKGIGTFEEIARILRKEKLSFAVNLGDFVRKGTEYYHAWFRAEYSQEINFPFPMFLVIGNHDIDPTDFPISKFEDIYGPTIFSFPYQGCLFVFLRVLPEPYSIKPSLQFLRKLASQNPAQKYKHIFIFMHIPPRISKDFKARGFAHEAEFTILLKKIRPDYVIAGDYHGYARVKIDDTVYLVSGGGGARLKKSKYGQFHHAIVITVTKKGISEKILMVKNRKDLQDMIERFAIAEFYPVIKKWLR